MISLKCKSYHVTPLLKVQWPSIANRIKFQLFTLTFKVLHDLTLTTSITQNKQLCKYCFLHLAYPYKYNQASLILHCVKTASYLVFPTLRNRIFLFEMFQTHRKAERNTKKASTGFVQSWNLNTFPSDIFFFVKKNKSWLIQLRPLSSPSLDLSLCRSSHPAEFGIYCFMSP